MHAEDDIGRGAEERRRVVGDDRLLVEQLVQHPVRLQHARAPDLFCSQARHWLTQPRQQRREQQRDDDLQQLRDEHAGGPCVIIAHQHQHADQREEAVEQIDRDAALLETGRSAATAARPVGQRQIEPVPEVVVDDDAVARLRRSNGDGQFAAASRKNGSKICADRLAEALGRVLHARGPPREAAGPGRRAPHAPVVEPAHEQRTRARSTPRSPSRKITGP